MNSKLNLDNICEGMIVKNYKEMCKNLYQDILEGSSKISQLKEWRRYFKFEIQGHKYFINKIYDNPNGREDLRTLGNHSVIFPTDNNFIISFENRNSRGVYIIKLKNIVYVGSTVDSFRSRYRSHLHNSNNIMSHTQKLLNDGATFDILWIANDTNTELEIRLKEQEYIDLYKQDINYILINRRNERLPLKKIYYINKKSPKIKTIYKSLKIDSSKLELVMNFLIENNIEYK